MSDSTSYNSKGITLVMSLLQLLLLALGIVWSCWFSKGRLSEVQIPGFIIALSISWCLTPQIMAQAVRLGLVDKPGGERRIHTTPVPRLGGIPIFFTLLVTLTLIVVLTGRFPRYGGWAGIAVGGSLVFILGLLDDLESIPAKIKLLVQILAGCAAYVLGVRIKQIPIPLNMDLVLGPINIHGGESIVLGLWGLPLTVFWLVAIANAVNLIDGMDGLAAGVSLISAITMWAVALAPSINQPFAALFAAVLAGALLGFLRWNFNPARIFLGDSGAYLTGFVLGAVAITGVLKSTTAATLIAPTFILVLLILFFPLLDTSWAVIRRVVKHRSIFSPDAEHIHHSLLKAGLSQKNAAYLIYTLSALLGLAAARCVGQQVYFLKLSLSVLALAVFFSEVINRHRQRRDSPRITLRP